MSLAIEWKFGMNRCFEESWQLHFSRQMLNPGFLKLIFILAFNVAWKGALQRGTVPF